MDVDKLALELETLAAEQALEAVLAANTSTRVCITSSFQAEDMIVTQLLKNRMPDVPVLFLDTGYHFPQTYEYRDRMTRQWSLNLVNVLPPKRSPSRNPRSAFCIAASPPVAASCARSNPSCERSSRLTFGSPGCAVSNRPRAKI